MRISESCAVCLYDRQKNKTDNEEYLSEIRNLLEACENGKSFLLVCDNCGEIVLDKLLLEQIANLLS